LAKGSEEWATFFSVIFGRQIAEAKNGE
jgi:hypothetical protein